MKLSITSTSFANGSERHYTRKSGNPREQIAIVCAILAMLEFKPPKNNKFIIWLSKQMLPIWLSRRERLSIEFADDCANLIQRLRYRRVVVVFNHPDRQDPFAACAFAKLMGSRFFCVIAREVFNWNHGWRGWLFQSLGGYSVDRGRVDFESLAVTRAVLSEPGSKLVLFPEAEVTYDDYFVQPIEPGVFHLLLDCQSNEDGSTGPGIVILPVALRYRLNSELPEAIGAVMAELAEHLHVKITPENIQANVLQLARAYFDQLAKFYNMPFEGATLDAVVLANEIMKRIERDLGADFAERPPMRRYQCLWSIVATKFDEIARERSDGWVEFKGDLLKRYEVMSNDLARCEHLIYLDRALQSRPSNLQLCRILDVIEDDVLDRLSPKGRQTIQVALADPIELSNFAEKYKQNKSAAVDELREVAQYGLQSALDDLTLDRHYPAREFRRQSA